MTLNFHGLEDIDATSPEARARIDALAHRSFIDPMLNERLVSDTRSITDWSFVAAGDLESIHQPLDFLGVNSYYATGVRLWDGKSPRTADDGHRDAGGTAWPGSRDVEFVSRPGPRTAMGWGIAPDGLEKLLLSLHGEFPELPLIIAENGAAFDDVVTDGDVHDVERTDYLRSHFDAAQRAIAAGVDLRGYLVWSLLDNFEWGWGYAKRFGIVRVEYATQERIVKDSAKWLAGVIASQPT